VRQIVRGGGYDAADVAASFQAAVIDVLCDRTRAAMAMFRADCPHAADAPFVIAGGVAANRSIRETLGALGAQRGFPVKIPPPGLCTDNAAMVAWAGVERGQLGLFDGLGALAKPRWPLDALTGGRTGAPKDAAG
jgi:N6-L-threonylcarbamoyladenine synthase